MRGDHYASVIPCVLITSFLTSSSVELEALRAHSFGNNDQITSADGRTDGPTDGPTDRRTDGQTHGRTDARTDGRGRTDGRADGRADGRVDGRTRKGSDWKRAQYIANKLEYYLLHQSYHSLKLPVVGCAGGRADDGRAGGRTGEREGERRTLRHY